MQLREKILKLRQIGWKRRNYDTWRCPCNCTIKKICVWQPWPKRALWHEGQTIRESSSLNIGPFVRNPRQIETCRDFTHFLCLEFECTCTLSSLLVVLDRLHLLHGVNVLLPYVRVFRVGVSNKWQCCPFVCIVS